MESQSAVCTPSSVSDLPEHLLTLNPEQLEAVTHKAGPLLIFAGAGSGKTRVLTHRIAHLVREHDVSPSQILAVTFTNKAAREMKSRVARLFLTHGRSKRISASNGTEGGDAVCNGSNIFCNTTEGSIDPFESWSEIDYRQDLPWVTTFHSWAAQILRRHARYLEYSPNFVIYDTSDTVSALKRVYRKLDVDPRIIDPGTVRARIDRAKNAYLFSDSIRSDRYTPEPLRIMIADIFDAYQSELKSANAMDFGDLLCNIVTLFKLEPLLLNQYQQQIQHLMVDEYQDTNKVQYMLVQMLAQKTKNICVVGDDDQSIYAFRGATVENILNFKRDFPDAHVVTLDLNYRSTKNILQAANRIIAKNRTRQSKSMRTNNSAGRPITCFRAEDEIEEAEFIVREIQALKRENSKDLVPHGFNSIAVFYRTNAQSRAIEEAFCENGIPYEIFGGHKFYERKEIRDILAYFRLVLNPDDNEAFLRVVNTPPRGLGPTSIASLLAFADIEGLSLFSALAKALEAGVEPGKIFTATNRAKFSAFHRLMVDLQKSAATAELALSCNDGSITLTERINALPGFLKEIADSSGYIEKLKAEDTLESESRYENITELFTVALEFSQRALTEQFAAAETTVSDNGVEQTPPALRDFLDRVSLASDLDKENTKHSGDSGTVSMMTLHLCKGLEFDTVFLTGMEEGLLPHVRSSLEDLALEEERRLCYVGITRARKKLYLSRAAFRRSYGRGSPLSGRPSRFIKDLPVAVLEDRRSEFMSW